MFFWHSITPWNKPQSLLNFKNKKHSKNRGMTYTAIQEFSHKGLNELGTCAMVKMP